MFHYTYFPIHLNFFHGSLRATYYFLRGSPLQLFTPTTIVPSLQKLSSFWPFLFPSSFQVSLKDQFYDSLSNSPPPPPLSLFLLRVCVCVFVTARFLKDSIKSCSQILMDVETSPYSLQIASDMKRGCLKNRHSQPESPHHEEISDMPSSHSLQNLSNFIIPPLGVSTYNQNQTQSKGWIISPLDSRYRCVISTESLSRKITFFILLFLFFFFL